MKLYKEPKISSIVKSICSTNNLDYKEVVNQLKKDFPELWVRERCSNCNASMAMYRFNLDVLDLILLQKMGEALRKNILKGNTFTEANKIKVQDLETSYAVKSRTTQC